LKEEGKIGSGAADELFGELSDTARQRVSETGEEKSRDVEALAQERGLLIVRDDAAMEKWVDEVIAKNEKVAADVRGGKVQAVGRLVGEVMKLAGGAADAKGVREAILKRLGVG
jgi:aspartyl-tRNA(Asn)/glutamyl-tRNA(Gln) amidotransferase subunit B